jgi:hypothetical protein
MTAPDSVAIIHCASQVATFISEARALATQRRLTNGIAGRFPIERVIDAYEMLEADPHGKVLVPPHGG